MPPFLQVKLLRALQDKTITRVGGVEPIKVNVRIVAATHRHLAQMVKEGTFREDLYYRLMVVPLHIAPLRDRKEDIPLLVVHFLDKFNQSFGFTKTMLPEVIDRMTEYSWPGNVRELENVIERLIVTTPGDEIDVASLPVSLHVKPVLPKPGAKLKEAVESTEKYLLASTLKEYGTLQLAANVLGIDRSTCFRKAVKYGLVANK
ncbi:Transcriptional regulatory protein ZraR [bioreactor metagenome]|uniref:Transcriptional regulatory protein ZraR n=1 Tax=bioreactor metagenome TaxID=1076179 RepID=A0A645EUC1_9ZZZZ